MKKSALILVAVLLLTACVACAACERAVITEEGGGTETNTTAIEQNGIQGNPNPTPTVISGEVAVLAPNKWVMEGMTYFTGVSNQEATTKIIDGVMSVTGTADMLLHATDHSTGQSFVLCNRPDCKHNSVDCGAFLPPCVFEDDDDRRNNYPPQFFLDSFIIFADGDYIYAHNGYNAFYRFNLDGSGRTMSVRVPDKYDVNNVWVDYWLMDGKLYIVTNVHKPTSLIHNPVALVKVLLEIDYKNGAVREVWQQEICEQDTASLDRQWAMIIGGFDGKFYISETVHTAESIYAEGELDSMSLISIDTASGNIETITTKSGAEMDGFVHDFRNDANPAWLYFSRKDGAFIHFDFITKESTIIADGFSGQWHILRALHGKLLITNLYDENTQDSKNQLICIDTGEVTDSTLPDISFTDGDWVYMVVQSDEERLDEDEYGGFVLGENSRYLVGRILAVDYLANNESAIEEIGWYTFEELRDIQNSGDSTASMR
jgi:hypothetical protein